MRGHPLGLLPPRVELRLQLLGDVPNGVGEGLQLLARLLPEAGAAQRLVQHRKALMEVLELHAEGLGVPLLEEPGLGRPALPKAALQRCRLLTPGGLKLRVEAPIARLGGPLRCQELEELAELRREGMPCAVVIQAPVVADDRRRQHAQDPLLDAAGLVELCDAPEALDAALDVAQLHANAQEALPHPPVLAGPLRGLYHAVPRFLELPAGRVRRRQVGPGLAVLVIHADAAREACRGVVPTLQAHLRAAASEPDVLVQRVHIQGEQERVDGLRQVALAKVVAPQRTLRTGEAAPGERPGRLVVRVVLLQVAQAAPEPRGRALLQQVLDEVQGLDVPLRHHEAIYGLGPHAERLELLVGGAHHAHAHHPHTHLLLEVEARRVARTMHEQQAVGGRGPGVAELVHKSLELEGGALARLVAVVLRAAAVPEPATEDQPVGCEQLAIRGVVLSGLVLGHEDALGEGVHLLQQHLVVGVARDPEVAAPGEQHKLLGGAKRPLQQRAVLRAHGLRELCPLQHVGEVIDALELQVPGRPGGRVAAARGSRGRAACLDSELGELLCLVAALDAQDTSDLELEVDGAAGRLQNLREGLCATIPAEAHADLSEQYRADGRRGQRKGGPQNGRRAV
mmetsp:Transcript_75337/g.243636  ORF Transcript_75337/g.243636 Transcript_75337/m.243636 type:complete len:626 (-) Transcript_75337:992-2869(-)